ncbi:MAG TPA: DUF1501 domain-containing protein [Solirubrobacteraceae bacterium]|jgi:uncharacterized protein (DUF1501 family)|nr:DUF1501 domain-containing protein [Solirubrobacteraceae bacterium]
MADCCDDFTRSHLVRGSIARAGAGLPLIEPGMPVPAGTGLTRRSMMLRSAGLALAVYGSGRALTPQAFEAAIAEAAGDHKVLVSIFMDGGADSLSLLAPVGDSNYLARRPSLRMLPGAGPAFGGDPSLQWHPSAQGLKDLWDASGVGVAVAPAIGYDSPNQSHFTSRHFWEVGATDPNATTGWLGRYLDRVGSPNVPIQGLSLDNSLSPQLATASVAVAATDNIGGYQFQMTNVWGAMQTRMRTGYAQLGACASADPITAQARQAQANSAQLSTDLASVGNGAPQAVYPAAASGFKTRLQAVARLLGTTTAGGDHLPVRCVTLSAQGGYDTHSNQSTQFSDNLLATAGNIRAFWQDLEARGLSDRVVITLWSEFGRRLAENGSGTDHGAAGAAFVIGKDVKQGVIGGFPGLASGTGGGLDSAGNLRATSDFRGLYCSLLEQWFQTAAAGIIPAEASFTRYALL